jgi:hypothetical protein
MLRMCEATVACHVVTVCVVHVLDPGKVELHLDKAYQADSSRNEAIAYLASLANS